MIQGVVKMLFCRSILNIFVNFCTRVRFAPSPTGKTHIGGLKTALINYIFAKSQNGKLIFRLEDTDRVRYDNKSVDNIIKSLTWLGINFDEGIEAGQPHKDYVQSNRLIHYQNAAERLLAEEKAYHCFCSSDRLEFLRKEQNRRGESLGYDRKCSKLTYEEITEKLQQRCDYVIRLKIEDDCKIEVSDEVFGMISIPISSVDRDPIILKTDGYPVYHLSNVVDDHQMGITHVIRGQEWLVSIPKHILLYRAFGWKPPKFAHLPLIMKEDGHKISKRDPDFLNSFYNIDNLIDNGFSPEVVISWLMSCGGGLARKRHNLISVPEIIEKFSLSRISTHSAGLSDDTLHIIGQSHMKSLVLTHPYFVNNIAPFLSSHNIRLTYEEFNVYFQRLKHRMSCLKDFTKFSYLWDFNSSNINEIYPLVQEDVDDILKKDIVQRLLKRLLDIVKFKENCISKVDMIHDGICCKSSAMKCLRKSLINQIEGPRISELMSMLTEDEIFRRINSVLYK